MKLDEKTVADLAQQLGVRTDGMQVKDQAARFAGKNDSELAAEILRLQTRLREADIPYEQQLAIVQSLAPMMQGEQKARLEKVLGLMKKSE